VFNSTFEETGRLIIIPWFELSPKTGGIGTCQGTDL